MRLRPGTTLPDGREVQGEGLVVVDPGPGAPARRYAGADLPGQVASIRVADRGDRLVVSADAAVTASEHADACRALASFGDELAALTGTGPLRVPPRVWCTWYRYFEDVTADDVAENLVAFDARELAVDVVQVDDGWSRGVGEWLEPAPGFPDVAGLVAQVRDSGRQPGVWVAPFVVGRDTDLARRHPGWLLGDAGHNWGQDLAGLDLTHPEVRDWLHAALGRLRDTGFGYYKLDFLYAGALPGARFADATAVAAYRSGLELVRDAVGPDAYLLGCGAPIVPSVGLVDAMRVSSDTFHRGGEGSPRLRGRANVLARAWQQGRLWVNDPDCLIADARYPLRERWAQTVRTFGGLRSCSDRVADLDEWGLRTTREYLLDRPAPVPFADEVLALAADAT
jgi:alpha-galactosidase